MKRDCVIVRFNEIGLKSSPVQRKFVKLLIRNIKKASSHDLEVENPRMRILLYTNEPEEVINDVRSVFGISSLSACVEVKQELDVIKREAVKLYTNGSFRITTQRVRKNFHLTSQEVSELVGAYVVSETNAGVDLEDYDVNIQIELFNNKAYLFTEKIRGFDGLPVGASGKVLSVVSSEDDMLATLLIMNRGCEVIVTGDREWFKKLNGFAPHLNLEFYDEVEDVISDCYAVVLGKRVKEWSSFMNDKRRFEPLPVFYPLIALNPSSVKRRYFEC